MRCNITMCRSDVNLSVQLLRSTQIMRLNNLNPKPFDVEAVMRPLLLPNNWPYIPSESLINELMKRTTSNLKYALDV